MAQQTRGYWHKVSKLARRYGLKASVGAAVLCMAFVVAAAALGTVGNTTGLTIARDDDLAEGSVDYEGSEGDSRAGGDSTESGTQAAAHDSDDSGAQGAAGAEDDHGASGEQRVVVHMDGAVASPGVYVVVGRDLRINDAVTQAGGLADDADTSTINLAAPLSDGQKVYVPHEGEEAPALSSQPGEKSDSQSADAEGRQGQASVDSTATLINVNTATVQELTQLPGVGEKIAQSIVDEREANGPFQSAEDLMRVSGIGQKKLDKMREYICVS